MSWEVSEEAGRKRKFHEASQLLPTSFFSFASQRWCLLALAPSPPLASVSSRGGGVGEFCLPGASPPIQGVIWGYFCVSQQAAGKCQQPKLPKPRPPWIWLHPPTSPSIASSQAANSTGNNFSTLSLIFSKENNVFQATDSPLSPKHIPSPKRCPSPATTASPGLIFLSRTKDALTDLPRGGMRDVMGWGGMGRADTCLLKTLLQTSRKQKESLESS